MFSQQVHLSLKNIAGHVINPSKSTGLIDFALEFFISTRKQLENGGKNVKVQSSMFLDFTMCLWQVILYICYKNAANSSRFAS